MDRFRTCLVDSHSKCPQLRHGIRLLPLCCLPVLIIAHHSDDIVSLGLPESLHERTRVSIPSKAVGAWMISLPRGDCDATLNLCFGRRSDQRIIQWCMWCLGMVMWGTHPRSESRPREEKVKEGVDCGGGWAGGCVGGDDDLGQ